MRKDNMKTVSILIFLGLGILVAIFGFAKPGIPISEEGQKLLGAVAKNDLAAVPQLLQRGANVDSRDARGRTALLVAVAANYIDMARLLIDAGADVNAQDQQSDSPLLLAGAEGTLEILKLILQAKPDFSLYNRFGGTPLIPACERGHVEVVKTLLQTDVEVDHVNNLGWTALLEAIILSDGGPRHEEIVQLLVDGGADVNIADFLGVTPLQHARLKGFRNIAKILESGGAK
jgi:ankyrin repeat protein